MQGVDEKAGDRAWSSIQVLVRAPDGKVWQKNRQFTHRRVKPGPRESDQPTFQSCKRRGTLPTAWARSNPTTQLYQTPKVG